MEEILKKLIASAIEDAMKENTQNAAVREIMTREQLADYLQVSIAWVDKNVSTIPHLKGVGGTRFRKMDIDAWLDNKLICNENIVHKVSVGKVACKSKYKVV